MKKQAKASLSDFSWFDLKNYEFINDLAVIELTTEIYMRCVFFHGENGLICFLRDENLDILNFDNDKYDFFSFCRELSKQILSGKPHLKNYLFNSPDEIITDTSTLTSINNNEFLVCSFGVYPLSLSKFTYYADIIKKISVDEFNENHTGIDITKGHGSVSMNIKKRTPDFNNSVLTEIHLDSLTDAEILANIKGILPKWREQLGVVEPEIASDRMGLKTIQKLVSYRVIPMLDILLWGKVHNKEISNAILDRLIFLDDPKDTQAIKETIKPFALNASGDNFRRSVSLYLDQDGELGSAKVSDLMSR